MTSSLPGHLFPENCGCDSVSNSWLQVSRFSIQFMSQQDGHWHGENPVFTPYHCAGEWVQLLLLHHSSSREPWQQVASRFDCYWEEIWSWANWKVKAVSGVILTISCTKSSCTDWSINRLLQAHLQYAKDVRILIAHMKCLSVYAPLVLKGRVR